MSDFIKIKIPMRKCYDVKRIQQNLYNAKMVKYLQIICHQIVIASNIKSKFIFLIQ